MSAYLLSDMFTAAGIKDIPASANYIEVRLPPDFDDEEGRWNKPRPDQIGVLNMAMKSQRFGNYSEPGVGKTVVAQALGLYWIFSGERCLVVMPPILLYQFKESLSETFYGSDKFVYSHVLDDEPAKRSKLFAKWKEENSWPGFLMMSYEMYLRLHLEFKGIYNVLICDEAQNLKNVDSKTYSAVLELLGKWDDSILHLMTGTPAHRDLLDCYALIKLTNPKAYSSLRDYQSRHCVYKKIKLKEPKIVRGKNGKEKKIESFTKLAGFKNIAGIHQALYANGCRITKDKVVQLQKPVVSVVPVKLDKTHKELYDRLSKERVLEIGDRLISALEEQALRQKLLQIVTFPELFVEDPGSIVNNILLTVDGLLDMIPLEETKVILFANYKESVKQLAKRYEKYNPAILNGGVSNPEAQKNKFLKDLTCRMLVANPESAGVGLNLQSVCYNAIYAEPTGIPGDFKQALERIFRTGQKFQVNCWILKAMETISPNAIKNMYLREGAIRAMNRDKESLLKAASGADC